MRQHIMTAQLALSILTFSSTANAFFRLPCFSPLVVERADPIVSPGGVSGHAHTIMGGNGFGFEMDYAATQASTCTSCGVLQDKSNYWVPTLYYMAQNGSFISVGQNGGATVYYLQRNDPADANYLNIQAFPEGFRMVAGNPELRAYSNTLEQNAVTFACLGTKTAETHGFPNITCPDGLRAQIFFPSCWNGVDLDSDDHKSHVTYPLGTDHGSCPDFSGMWYGDSQPFVLSNGDPTGFGYHGDFVNGWDVPVLQSAVDNCTSDDGNIAECAIFDFVNQTTASNCVIPPSINEQIFGVMDKLPGCNPILSGPANAVMASNCGATTQIGQPQLPYVDLTKSKGFSYVGCGRDLGGQPRTLQEASTSNQTSMTVEYCVDYCNSRGFSVAGLEFSYQCFCDESIPSDRAPNPDLVGDCAMPCSGDSSEICGGPSLISLYQKCSESSCSNIELPFINGTAPTSPGSQSILSSGRSTSKSSVMNQATTMKAVASVPSPTLISATFAEATTTPAVSSMLLTSIRSSSPSTAVSNSASSKSTTYALGYSIGGHAHSVHSTHHQSYSQTQISHCGTFATHYPVAA